MAENQKMSVLLPDSGGMVVLQQIQEPYRPLTPFELPNKPQMIDPMVNPLQICMLDRSKVIAQCDSPVDENDYHGWQRIITFFRSVVEMVKPARPQLLFMQRGDVIGEPYNAPTTASDMNEWHSDIIQLRMKVGILRMERKL